MVFDMHIIASPDFFHVQNEVWMLGVCFDWILLNLSEKDKL